MKKQILAAAVAAAVAAPAAMAGATLSGQINQEFINGGADLMSDSNVDVVLKVSEDLGNGMKASVVIHKITDDGAYSAVADQSIAFSGSFGEVKIGRFEPFTENKVVAMAANDHADALSIETNLGNQNRSEGGMRYTSPAFSGFNVGVEAFADETVAGEDFSTTAIFAQGKVAGLLVRAAYENDNSAADADILTIGANYSLNGLTLGAVYSNNDTANTSELYLGAKYQMGANSVAISAIVDSDLATEGDWIASAGHNLSKSTSVYVAYENDDSMADPYWLIGAKKKF